MPGEWLEFGPDGQQRQGRYWQLEALAGQPQDLAIAADERAATDRLEALLSQAVAGQMVADVPLGAFLSGGVDSSTIVALINANKNVVLIVWLIAHDMKALN